MSAAVLLTTLLLLDPGRLAPADNGHRDNGHRDNRHRVEVSLGYAGLTLVDQAATRLPYRSPAAHARLRYTGERLRLRWWASLHANVGPLQAAGQADRSVGISAIDPIGGEVEEVRVPMRGRMLAPGVEVGVQAKLAIGDSPWTLLLGGAIGWDVAYPSGFATPGLMQALALRPIVGVRVEPHPKHRVEAFATTSLAAWTTRMPYHQSVSMPERGRVAGLFAQGSRGQSLATLQTFSAGASYEYRITPRWSVEARYQLRWLHEALPRDLRSVEHLVAFGFAVHF